MHLYFDCNCSLCNTDCTVDYFDSNYLALYSDLFVEGFVQRPDLLTGTYLHQSVNLYSFYSAIVDIDLASFVVVVDFEQPDFDSDKLEYYTVVVTACEVVTRTAFVVAVAAVVLVEDRPAFAWDNSTVAVVGLVAAFDWNVASFSYFVDIEAAVAFDNFVDSELVVEHQAALLAVHLVVHFEACLEVLRFVLAAAMVLDFD